MPSVSRGCEHGRRDLASEGGRLSVGVRCTPSLTTTACFSAMFDLFWGKGCCVACNKLGVVLLATSFTASPKRYTSIRFGCMHCLTTHTEVNALGTGRGCWSTHAPNAATPNLSVCCGRQKTRPGAMQHSEHLWRHPIRSNSNLILRVYYTHKTTLWNCP